MDFSRKLSLTHITRKLLNLCHCLLLASVTVGKLIMKESGNGAQEKANELAKFGSWNGDVRISYDDSLRKSEKDSVIGWSCCMRYLQYNEGFSRCSYSK